MTSHSVRGSGMVWPTKPAAWAVLASTTLDAANESVALIGRVRWADGGSHTIDTSGSSKIYLHTGATAVFDDAAAVMDIGIQDVDVATGQPVRPDGTFDVKAAVSTGADTSPALTTTNSLVAATPTTGTKTMAHGDLVAVVAKLVTVGASPASNVTFARSAIGDFSGSSAGFPSTVALTTGSWVSNGASQLIALLVASDGTYGTIEGNGMIGQTTTATFNDSSGTDEYGNIFQVPFDIAASGIVFNGGLAGATSDFQYDLYSTPLGTPASMLGGAVAVPAESAGSGSSDTGFSYMFPSAISLTKDTDYCVAIKATGAGNVTLYGQTLPAAAARSLLPGGTTTFGASRNNGSGAFSTSSTIIRAIGIRVGDIVIPTGGGTSYSPLFGF